MAHIGTQSQGHARHTSVIACASSIFFINVQNAPSLLFLFKFLFLLFFYVFMVLCFLFSLSCWFSIVERGSGSVEVKVLPVGDCCDCWFVFIGDTSDMLFWLSSDP